MRLLRCVRGRGNGTGSGGARCRTAVPRRHRRNRRGSSGARGGLVEHHDGVGVQLQHRAGQDAESGPSTAAAIASALWLPVAMSTRRRASCTVPRPWVAQSVGTWSRPSKKRALSSRVCAARRLMRVRLRSDEAGSLKPRCPLARCPGSARRPRRRP